MPKLKALRAKNPKNFIGGVGVVMDNWSVHKKVIKQLGGHCIPIPANSPEFNKPIEHLFNLIKAEFGRRYSELLIEAGSQRFIPLAAAKALLKTVVYDVVNPKSIAKDVDDLTRTYKAIIAAKGGYISSRVS